MVKAKITNKDGYRCYIMGQLVVSEFGAEVEGRVAEFALADKSAKRIMRKKDAGAAPENKSK